MTSTRPGGWPVFALFALAVLQAGHLLAADPDTRVVAAAKKHDSVAVRALLAQRADVNGAQGDGATAILWAAAYSDLEMARMLIAAKADVNQPNRLGVTPLIQASRLGNALMVEALLKAGADPKRLGPEGETTLMAASGSGSLEAVKMLLARGVDSNAKEQAQSQTALMWAADEGHLNVVQTLLAAGADPNAAAKAAGLSRAKMGDQGRMWVDHPSGGLTALMFAARQGHIEVARALADAHADLNYANPDGLTAMIIAVINDRLDLAGMLVEKGANPNDGSLYEVIQMHNLRTNETTGEATRPRVAHANTLTPLDLMAQMLDKGADPNRVASHAPHLEGTAGAGGGGTVAGVDETSFARALRAQDVAALRLLLAKGASANAANAAGVTPLMTAVGGGGGGRGFAGGFGAQPAAYRFPSERTPIELAKALLDAGADVNAASATGDTALHLAAQGGNVPMIQLLADRGAKLEVQNKAGFTPLDAAMGKRAPGGNAAGRGAPGGGGPPGRGGGPGGPQPQAVALLRQLMGLPPDTTPPAAAPGPGARSSAPGN